MPDVDPRCTCGQEPHLQTCWIERERRALANAVLRAAVQRLEERASGLRLFATSAQALRWYYTRRRCWSSPSSVRLDPDTTIGGGRARDDLVRRRWAAIAYAIRVAEDDDRARGDHVPLAEALAEHHGARRGIDAIAESRGLDRGDVRRALARAHRVIRARLAAAGVLEEDLELP